MAEGKKSFIAYADWNGMFKALPDEVAGKLIKHIFSYVNDENPITEDFIINALFEQIKSTLKRDLEKWESQLEQRRNAGKASAESRKNKNNESNERSTVVENRQRNSTVSVSVSDNVSDNDSVLLKKETKFNAFDFLVFQGSEKDLVKEWFAVRKTKSLTNSKTAMEAFLIQVEKSKLTINEVLKKCIIKSWGGFDHTWLIKEAQEQSQILPKKNHNIFVPGEKIQ